MAIVGSAIGAVGSIIGGKSQAKAADKAAQAQVEAQKIATDEAKRQFDAMMSRTQPQYDAGMNALAKQMFYAGVAVPQGMAQQVKEAGGNIYPQMDPFTGQISYPDVLGGGAVNPPTSAIANNQRQEGTWLNSPYKNPMGASGPQLIDSSYSNQNWLEDFMKQQAIADYYSQGG